MLCKKILICLATKEKLLKHTLQTQRVFLLYDPSLSRVSPFIVAQYKAYCINTDSTVVQLRQL